MRNIPDTACLKSFRITKKMLARNTRVLEDLRKRQHHKSKGRPPYSAELIGYALLLRYTSAQAYPYFPLLRKYKKEESTRSKLKGKG